MNLVPLFEEALEFQDYNGTVLSNGKVAVFYIGRTRLADIFNDIEGLSPAENPRILNNLGMGPIYVNPAFDYEMVVYDAYDNELFSVKKYVLSRGEHSTANVVVTPSESIAVSAWTIGDVQVYMPYLTGQLGKVYTGIDPIVVNNTEDKISANHVPLGVQEPLYFVQDDEEGCIIGFSGQTIPEGVMSESALGFENDKITGYNGSAFSAGNEYEPGANIDITNGVISGRDWTDEIRSAASDASAAATAWTDSQGYLTGVDLSEYAKESFVISAIDSSTSGLLPTSAFATASGSFITALPDDLATTGFVADVSADITAMIPTALTGDYLTKESADTLYQPIGQYQSALDFGYVGSEISSINGSGIYSQGGTANPQIPVTSTSGISIFESGDQVYFNISANYATEDWVTGQGYLTAETDWTNTITAASANAYNEATAAIPTGLATTGDLQTVSGEITAMIPSTAGLATEDWVTAQGYLTTSYNPEFAYHDTAISSIDNSGLYDTSAHARINTLAGRISDLSSNKLDTTAFSDVSSTFLTAHQDLSDYQTTAGMTAYMTTADSAEFMTTAERADYIPTGVSSEFYTTANTAGYISTIPDTYLQNTDLATADGKVTAISGIPLSAGGDVPEGVMVESGLEYNAVGEISGYGNSAIAQYGAEKQWLQHDDTIVSISNSAQYAFGCNISALQRLMGIDETVLWSNSAGSITATGINFVLSEPYTAFNKLKFVMRMDQTTEEVVLLPNSSFSAFGIPFNYTKIGDGAWTTWTQVEFSTDTTARITKTKALQYPWTSTAKQADGMNNNWEWTCRALTKIIGVGRKEV